MKALVIGYGSIGRRHVANLCAVETIKNVIIYSRHITGREGQKHEKIEFADSIGRVQADFAVVCNETHNHLPVAMELASRGMPLFIEKPLSDSLDGTSSLHAIVKKQSLPLFIGYNLRFLGAINFVKEQVAGGIIGKPYFASINAGQYLPAWRPGNDYRACYSARKSLGGGVALDLSHEIDYMRYIFGEPYNWTLVKTKVSDLEIDCEDLFEGIYTYPAGFTCSVHLDYLQQQKQRSLRVVGSSGAICCNLVKKTISIDTGKNQRLITDEKLFDIDNTYKDEMDHFINIVSAHKNPCITIDDGIKALQLIEEMNVQR